MPTIVKIVGILIRNGRSSVQCDSLFASCRRGDAGWLNGITPQQFYLKQLQWWADCTGLLGAVYAWGDEGTFDVRGLL